MNALINLIKFFEGCKLVAYLCPAAVWTCGWGSTGPDVKKGTTWTQSQADARMDSDAKAYFMAAGKLSPSLFTVGADKHCAIADFCYNLGATRYKASTLKRRVDAGDWTGAIVELKKWVKGGGRTLPGLVARREAEASLIRRSAT